MRNRGEHLGDPRLKHRVKQYLRNSRDEYVDIGILAADLQRLYSSDYGRRKRNAFRIQVDKVFQSIRNEMSDLEEEHLVKRARQNRTEDGRGMTSDSSDSEDYPEYPLTNHMNTSLLSLYRKTNPDPPSTPAARKVPEGGSTHGHEAPGTVGQSGESLRGTVLSEGGWFIDNTPGVPLSKDRPVDVKESRRQNSERLEASPVDRAERKRRRLNKRKQQDREESKDVDAQIESSALNRKAVKKGFELQHSTVTFEDVGGCEGTLKVKSSRLGWRVVSNSLPGTELGVKGADCIVVLCRGADLSALVREASINALRQHLSGQPSEQAPAPCSGIRVARQHFEAAFEKVKPSVSKKDQLMYELLQQSLSQS
ncbi:nuclear valosin-containing protein-like [Rhincodon typus]|uniref:nuclear valosin-containing protein-like n=1 Tax=Rhincodon typus TaxID=259920 RepID=UPI00202FFBCA|nr:nuclear valosin-containing protein-like [Rhincodon typus]